MYKILASPDHSLSLNKNIEMFFSLNIKEQHKYSLNYKSFTTYLFVREKGNYYLSKQLANPHSLAW